MKLSSWPEIGSDGDVLLTPYVPKGITGYDDDDDDGHPAWRVGGNLFKYSFRVCCNSHGLKNKKRRYPYHNAILLCLPTS